ncbi:MAG: Rpn family recombination-promoting nuclease/putative transposase [Aureispira sp.]
MERRRLIRFDWAIKKLLRDKANFGILEGFLSELLQDNMVIIEILDSESNKETENDKHNRVDILVKNSKDELIIIEVQNSKEYDYFHRILFGTSKAITEHITEGQAYSDVKKVISITIAYFDLGQGKDYLYHGKNEFTGVHFKDKLSLAPKQKELYDKQQVFEIFPEYWLIKVEKFKEVAHSKIDEWIYFLKTGEIQKDFSAKGLQEAKAKLDTLHLSEEERKSYAYYLKRLRDQASEHHTRMADYEDAVKKAKKEGIERGIEQGIEREKVNAILGLYKNGVPLPVIALSLNVTEEFVLKVIEEHS